MNRIILLLSNYLFCPSCTKCQLLSLLGHLNYSLQIIPQGRSFLSHLLQLASSAHSPHQSITFNPSCTKELDLWRHLLSHLNGISFFYNDHVTNPEDTQLFTDAAPSVGFGCYCRGRWFASLWPREFSLSLSSSSFPSSALHELYPILVVACLWGHEWSRKSILIHSDNSALVAVINKGRFDSISPMPVLRHLTWLSVTHCFILRAAHVPGHHNCIADSLYRFEFQRFRRLASDTDLHPTPIPSFSLRSSPKRRSSQSPSPHPINHTPGSVPRTLSTYWTAWTCFRSFHSSNNFTFPSFDLLTITSFISHTKGHLSLRTTTVQVYHSGIFH